MSKIFQWLDDNFDGTNTIIAFDFDLTLKAPSRVMRDEERTRSVLHKLKDRGVPMVIVTATKPSVSNWESIWKEIIDLNLVDIIGQGYNQSVIPHTGRKHSKIIGYSRLSTYAQILSFLAFSFSFST